MEKTMSPSRKVITEPQVDKLKNMFVAAVRKTNPFSDEAQVLIEDEWDLVRDELLEANVNALNTVLDRKRNTITVTVEVLRGRTGQQVLDTTKRRQYTSASSVPSIPLTPDGPTKGVFVWFKPGRRMSDAEIELERAKYGVVQDLEMQAQYNADHLEFADDHPNGDSWQDVDGNWHFAHFYCWIDGRRVDVSQSELAWGVNTWFGGRRK